MRSGSIEEAHLGTPRATHSYSLHRTLSWPFFLLLGPFFMPFGTSYRSLHLFLPFASCRSLLAVRFDYLLSSKLLASTLLSSSSLRPTARYPPPLAYARRVCVDCSAQHVHSVSMFARSKSHAAVSNGKSADLSPNLCKRSGLLRSIDFDDSFRCN